MAAFLRHADFLETESRRSKKTQVRLLSESAGYHRRHGCSRDAAVSVSVGASMLSRRYRNWLAHHPPEHRNAASRPKQQRLFPCRASRSQHPVLVPRNHLVEKGISPADRMLGVEGSRGSAHGLVLRIPLEFPIWVWLILAVNIRFDRIKNHVHAVTSHLARFGLRCSAPRRTPQLPIPPARWRFSATIGIWRDCPTEKASVSALGGLWQPRDYSRPEGEGRLSEIGRGRLSLDLNWRMFKTSVTPLSLPDCKFRSTSLRKKDSIV